MKSKWLLSHSRSWGFTVILVLKGCSSRYIEGPFPVLIFINDLCKSLQLPKLCMNTYDTSFLCSSKKKPYELFGRPNKKLFKINRWFVAKRLLIMEIKTKLVFFHRSNKIVATGLLPIYIWNASVNREYSINFSGVRSKEHVLNVNENILKLTPLIYRF